MKSGRYPRRLVPMHSGEACVGKVRSWEKNPTLSAENRRDPKARWHQLVTFWGVRGTMPTPGTSFLRYGGHTPCVEVRSFEETTSLGQPTGTLLCDGGSGLIKCGENALARGDREFHILLSHMHYDHMLGFQKFLPMFRTDCDIHIYGLAKGNTSLKELFSRYFAFPFFPVEFADLPVFPRLHFHEVNTCKSMTIAQCEVDFFELHHPQQAVGFRVWSPDKSTSMVYATDHEHGSDKDQGLIEFISDTTLFLFDSTFTDSNYSKHLGWGHSTGSVGAQFAKKAQAKAYGLFHHDPDACDAQLENGLLPEAQNIFESSFLTREGDTLHLPTLGQEGLEKARTEGEFYRFAQKAKDLKTG
jgi:phosphoribosyl 1,2-cyclic phosphodiesterase